MWRLFIVLLLIASPAFAQTGLPWTATFGSSDFSEWNRGVNLSGNITVGNTGCQSPPCACATLTSGTENENTYAEHAIGDYYSLPGAPNTKVTEIWMVMYAKLGPSNYNLPGDSQKIFIFNYTDGTNSQRTYQIYVFWRQDGTIVVDRADWTGGGTFTPINQNTNLPAYVWEPDTWVKFKIHVKNNTSGNSDGVVQLWINDVLKVDRSNINIVGTSGHGIGKIILSGYTNDATDTNGTQCWDTWSATLTDPDAGGEGPVIKRRLPRPRVNGELH